MKRFDVWLHIEEYDDETKEGHVALKPDLVGSFDCVELAVALHCAILEHFATEELQRSEAFEQLTKKPQNE